MPRGTEKPSEFKRYQQALAICYAVVISAGTLLLAASVVRGLLFQPQPAPRALSHADLLRCHQDVSSLLDQLNHQAQRQLRQPTVAAVDGAADPPASDWQSFAASWRQTWRSVNQRCQFSMSPRPHPGDAYQRMAEVHQHLSAIELKYQSLVTRFERELSADLVALTRSLSRSQKLLRSDDSAQDANRRQAR